MILRLVYSFFFISLVTGDQRLNETTETARSVESQNKICVCQDQVDINASLPHATLLKTTHTQLLQNTQPPLKVVEGHYGYPARGLISANPVHSTNPQSRLETRGYDMQIVSDDSSSFQAPQPFQYLEEETEYTEKTICFTPSMVHKIIKAALEYVSQIPSDINSIVEKLDQELNMSDKEIEENAVRKPLYPFDSKTIFQILDKQRSKTRTNLILKYELPIVKESLCREGLEKLIDIAYSAYLELEEHPQCRDYLYNFAAHGPEDRPKGHLNPGPDLKSLIAAILDQVDNYKPNLDIAPHGDRYGDVPVVPDNLTPQYNIPQVQEYNIPQKPQNLEYNIPRKPKTLEYNIPQQPQTPEYNIPQQPQTPEYNIPQQPQTPEYNIPQQPQTPEYNIPQQPQTPEYNIPQQPQTPEYNIPQQPQTPEYIIPQQLQTPEYNIPQQPQTPEYNIPQQPQTPEYNIPQQPQTPEYIIPQQLQTPEYIIPQQLQTPEYNIPQQPQTPEYIIPQQLQIPEYIIPQQLQTPEYNIPQQPQTPEYNIPQQPQTPEYNIPQQPQTPEYNIPQQPQTLEYNIPQQPQIQVPEYNVPQGQQLNINEYNVPLTPELMQPEFNLPNIHEYIITQTHEYNVPQINEFSVTQSNEYNVPKLHEYNVPKVHECITCITQSQEYNIPQIQDIIPQGQYIELPEFHETIHETVEEIIPMQTEEIINILITLLPKNDQIDSGNLFDRLMSIIEVNQNNFHPRIFKLLLTLLKTHKQSNIPKFNDIFLLLLDSQRNRDWPWSDRVTENILSYLIPDQSGYLDNRIVEIILNLYKKRPNEQQIEYILSLLRPLKEGKTDTVIGDLILKLIQLHQHNLMRPDHVDILLKLLKLSQGRHINPIDVEIIANLFKWNEIGLSPNQLNGLIALLKPFVNGHPDRKPVYIAHFLLTKGRNLNPKQLDCILSFLYPENGVLDDRRIDFIYFLLNNLSQYPKPINILLNLLQENGPAILDSKFLEILLFLNSHSMLAPELVETVINLLVNEVTGQLEDHQVKNLFFLLEPHKQSNPKLVVDVLTLLNQGGLYGNIFEWFETTNHNSKPNNVKLIEVQPENNNEYRIPDGGYDMVDTPQVPDQDIMSIFKWLERQGLITQDQGSNTDLVNQILKIFEVGQRELGVVELTYMLKHEKPLIYQPVYYVKYRLPILSFISNMKNLLLQNPNLNADPMKLLQELIAISNVTEVSPNLQGFPKEEILKLTFNDGDLVQAKILDEQNLSLNDQIAYVHGLNSDISPEELLQLNQMNEAKYFPNLLEVKGKHPETLTIRDVDKFIEVPPVHYRHLELPAVSQQSHRQTKTIPTHHKTYIARDKPKQDALHNNNAQLRSQK